jgi:hypothetical protein
MYFFGRWEGLDRSAILDLLTTGIPDRAIGGDSGELGPLFAEYLSKSASTRRSDVGNLEYPILERLLRCCNDLGGFADRWSSLSLSAREAADGECDSSADLLLRCPLTVGASFENEVCSGDSNLSLTTVSDALLDTEGLRDRVGRELVAGLVEELGEDGSFESEAADCLVRMVFEARDLGNASGFP